ncbi:hypothetical protein IGI04_033353 [Brassica rapa subsp. trilocularis]|uniref:Uncharacterized protein n=1 Tax=Brassica rapa subsp. trilocularis TaxID=1813537 RepID=A0ABQ7L8Z4_BRACM|nr:hypothetical protein IGI04_033353 [Brassica rapa subsp. trilocularis]
MANRLMRDKQQSHENPTQNQRNLRNPPSETPNPHRANCPGAFPEPNLRSEPRSLRFNPVTDPEPPRQPLRLCPQEAYLENNPFSPWEMTMDKQKTGQTMTLLVLLMARPEVMGGKRQKGNVHFRNRGCKEVFDCFQFSIVLGVFYCFYHHRHHHCRPTPRPQQFDLSASLSICFELILS